jgi:hypothetical protein
VTTLRDCSLVDRYYDPQTGQFLSVDPLVDETGEPYAYAADDPVDNTDPSGLRGAGRLTPDEACQRSQDRSQCEAEVRAEENGGGIPCSDIERATQTGPEALGLVLVVGTGGIGDFLEALSGDVGIAPEGEGELATTPEGRVYSSHYLNETGPLRNIPGSIVDETIDNATDVTQLSDRTIYYDAKNDVTVVQSDTTGKIMSVRRGAP